MTNSSAGAVAPANSLANWWRQKNLKQQAIGAFKTALAAVICIWLGNLLGLERSFWAAASAIVVMAYDTTMTFAACRDRIIGSAIGAFLGWVTFYVWHGHYLIYGLAVMLCIFICSLLAFDKAGRLAAVTLSVVVLLNFDGGPAHTAISRFLEVGLGIVVALAVTTLVFPSHQAQSK